MNLIRHCGSVSSVLSNDRLVRAYPASAGEAPREWVVKKKRTRHDVEKSTRPIYLDRQSGNYIQSELVNPFYAPVIVSTISVALRRQPSLILNLRAGCLASTM